MKIGFIGIRYTKGIGILAEDFARLAESLGHTVYFLSYPISRRRGCLVDGEWARDRVTIVKTFKRSTVRIDDETLADWIKGNELDLVFTIEEPNNIRTFEICKRFGIPTINYIDIEKFNPDLKGVYKDVNLFFCPTQHCYDLMFEYGYQNLMLVKYASNTHQFPWIHREVVGIGPVEFVMHNGWAGAGNRKGMEPTVKAFVKANNPNAHLTIITQRRFKTYDDSMRGLIESNKRIQVREKNNTHDVYNAADYSFGHIIVQPSLWEGLGLTYIEALTSGLPVITTNAPPMNEFVEHERTGLLIDADFVPGHQIVRNLRVSAALVRVEALAEAIDFIANNPSYIEHMSNETEKFRDRYAEYRESFKAMLERVGG
jgi:glycosyltransferase involved in cell wall biosynthesis